MSKKATSTSGNRFLKSKRQEALAEIEGWIAETRVETSKAANSRVSSQPSKNVTEQKMLDSKLYDMSKQRFNFILHCQWQRKLFLEKQKRKTVVMRDLLRNVDVTVVTENPFAAQKIAKRRATVIPAQRRPMSPAERDYKANTSISRPRDTSDQQVEVSPFVTQKDAYLARLERSRDTSVQSVISDENQAAADDQLSIGKSLIAKPWPMCDERYVKLSESLSDNYHGRVSQPNSSKGLTSVF